MGHMRTPLNNPELMLIGLVTIKQWVWATLPIFWKRTRQGGTSEQNSTALPKANDLWSFLVELGPKRQISLESWELTNFASQNTSPSIYYHD